MSGSYDDQHYSERNPDTLDYQDPNEVALTIWAALRPCREITGKGFNQDANLWIKWVKPKKWNPDCGMRIFERGRIFGKREFAQVVLNIVGDDFEISVWRKHHEGVVLFSTRDDGPILGPVARLDAVVSQMKELTTAVDKWTREHCLRKEFPKRWIGTSWKDIAKDLIFEKIRNLVGVTTNRNVTVFFFLALALVFLLWIHPIEDAAELSQGQKDVLLDLKYPGTYGCDIVGFSTSLSTTVDELRGKNGDELVRFTQRVLIANFPDDSTDEEFGDFLMSDANWEETKHNISFSQIINCQSDNEFLQSLFGED